MGKNQNGARVTMPIQVADVNKASGSAREMVEAGDRVMLDRDCEGRPCSCVLRKAAGHRTVIHERHGGFQFDLEMLRGNATRPVQQLSEDSRDERGSHRQGNLVEEPSAD